MRILNHRGTKSGTVVGVHHEKVYSVAFDDTMFCDHVEPHDVQFEEGAEEVANSRVKVTWEGQLCGGTFLRVNYMPLYSVRTRTGNVLELYRCDILKL